MAQGQLVDSAIRNGPLLKTLTTWHAKDHTQHENKITNILFKTNFIKSLVNTLIINIIIKYKLI